MKACSTGGNSSIGEGGMYQQIHDLVCCKSAFNWFRHLIQLIFPFAWFSLITNFPSWYLPQPLAFSPYPPLLYWGMEPASKTNWLPWPLKLTSVPFTTSSPWSSIPSLASDVFVTGSATPTGKGTSLGVNEELARCMLMYFGCVICALDLSAFVTEIL